MNETLEHLEDCRSRLPGHECDCGQTPDGPAQVWCDRCDQPATTSIRLTTGETAFRCSTDAWLIRGRRAVFA